MRKIQTKTVVLNIISQIMKKEISAMKHELNQMKAIVSQMGNQIMILSQELERTVKNSVKEIVEIIVKTIHNSKASEITSGAETKTDLSVQCDLCEFNCENENIMIAHMSDKHETR